MTWWSASKVCSTTFPPRSLRPARPATWVSTWKTRSLANGSGRCKPTSASTMPTRVTSGRSSPFASICVPINTSARWAAKWVRIMSCESFSRVVSQSQRNVRTLGKIDLPPLPPSHCPNHIREFVCSRTLDRHSACHARSRNDDRSKVAAFSFDMHKSSGVSQFGQRRTCPQSRQKI